MENILWYAGIGLLVYVIARLLAPKPDIDNDINKILSCKEYKVKGRFRL